MPQPPPSTQPKPLPGPAVVAASSAHPGDPPQSTSTSSNTPWIHPHRLPHRRFIGPLPESIINSPEVEQTRKWYDARRVLLHRAAAGAGAPPTRRERKEGGWVDVDQRGKMGNPVRKVGRVGRGVVEHVRGESAGRPHPHHHQQQLGRTSTDVQSVSAESYMTDETTTSDDHHPGPRRSSRWKLPWPSSSSSTNNPQSHPPRRSNVFTGESFTIGQPFLDSFSRRRLDQQDQPGERAEEEGQSWGKTRCEMKYGGLIDVDDEYISTSVSHSGSDGEGGGDGEGEHDDSRGKTIYGSPTAISLDLDDDQARTNGRPSLRSRGTDGTGVRSFQTARTHQPGSSTSFRTARTHQPQPQPRGNGTNTLGLGSRATSYQTSTMLSEDYQSAYSTLPPAPPSASELDHDQNAPRRTGSSSTAGGPGTTTTTTNTTDPFGSTRELIPPETGVTYDTSRLSDTSGYHLGVPPVQGGKGDRLDLQQQQQSQHGSMSLPLPRSTRLSGGKLKSALKFRNKGGMVILPDEEDTGVGYSKTNERDTQGLPSRPLGARTKTVQFPMGDGLDDRGSSMGDPNSLRSRFRGLRKRLKDDASDDGDDDDDVEDRDVVGDGRERDDHSLEPADPRQVLARTGSEVVGTSAGVVEAHQKHDVQIEPTPFAAPPRLKPSKTPGQSSSSSPAVNKRTGMSSGELGIDPAGHTEDDAGPDAVVLRDRMLVRVGRNRDSGLVDFDEAMLRRKPCSRLDRMEEYLVVYRKGRIELYQEWRIPLKERFIRTKRLCFTIPLRPKYTTFSLFSPVDLSFALCLDSTPFLEELEGEHGDRKAARIRQKLKDSKQLQWLKNGRGDTQVFIFNCRERRRAMDWMWEIWKDLDGVLPETLDVGIPDLQTTIRLKKPVEDSVGSMATCRALSRSKVLMSCLDGLRELPHFDDLVHGVEREMGERPRLELAWQREGHLDWITKQDEAAEDGCRREWALLAGLSILNPKHPARLVARPARHVTSTMKLTDGSKLEEPPSIEGYLYRLGKKTGTRTKEQIYVYSHGGNLFSSVPRNARPPLPPSHITLGDSAADIALLDIFMKDEYTRGARNVMECTGFVDFRDIAAVRSKANRPKKPTLASKTRVSEVEAAQESSPSDKGSKIFEIVLENTKDRVRFEAHDHDTAKEWIERLRKLHDYWSHRQRIDARERMDTVHSSLRGPEKFMQDAMGSSIDPEMPLQWNWCPIENCSPIVHSGRLFIKESRSSQFRAYFTVLTQGHLVLFKFEPNTALHRKTNRYSLLESYIYSGVLAEAELTSVLQENAFEGEARIYQDGLECADGAEDCTFVIWMRKRDHHSLRTKRSPMEAHQLTKPSEHYNPPLLGKPATVLLVLRARSKLERDKWVKATQTEIQRQAVAHPERTKKARTHGLVPEGISPR